MQVLITGANGFVGRAVCARLQRNGWPVIAAVRRPLTLPPGLAIRLLPDLGPETEWPPLLAGIDAVVHLAARVHVMRDAAADPLAAFRRVNTAGTLALAEAARQAGVRRFVFLSSIKVNGEGRDRPYDATDPPDPQDPYGRSKAEAEAGLAELAGDGFTVTILRPPLVYGPGVGGNFCRLLAAVARGWPLPLRGIDNRRSLIYRDNLADAVAVCLEQPPIAPCETFLLADGEDLSTADLAVRLGRQLQRPARLLRFRPGWLRLGASLLGRRAAVRRLTESLQVDASAFRQRYGWQPPVSLEDGLAATARWFSETS